MTKQIKTALLTGLFFFGLLTGLHAQDKNIYEFGAIVYTAEGTAKAYKLCFNTKDKYDCSEGKMEDGGFFTNLKVPLEKLHALSKEGWEVYAVEVNGGARTWHFKRKVN